MGYNEDVLMMANFEQIKLIDFLLFAHQTILNSKIAKKSTEVAIIYNDSK